MRWLQKLQKGKVNWRTKYQRLERGSRGLQKNEEEESGPKKKGLEIIDQRGLVFPIGWCVQSSREDWCLLQVSTYKLVEGIVIYCRLIHRWIESIGVPYVLVPTKIVRVGWFPQRKINPKKFFISSLIGFHIYPMIHVLPPTFF